ncbi:hypothetical protein FRC18_007636 [Serendipita sp. 400]|nr:hypothetical protein FRC18_007636 [Serendipita sp. 400]
MRPQVVLQVSPVAPAIIVYLTGGGLYIAGATWISLLFLQLLLLNERKQGTSRIHILFEPKDALVDIIAVQGLGSSYPHTWMGKRESIRRNTWFSLSKPKVERVMWLADYLPDDFPTARIMAFEYNSKWLYNADFQGLYEHASGLLNALVEQRRNSPGRPIMFIGHSYGGLVVKQTLVLSHRSKTDPPNSTQWVADAESGIAFLGTPHQGSNHATFALILSFIYRPFGGNYTHVLKLLSDSDRLVEVDREFKGIWSRDRTKQTICFYETKAQAWFWPLGLLVTRTSAYLGQGLEAPMECNHNEMNKFFDRDERYKIFVENLLRVYDPLANPVANDAVKEEMRKRLSGRIINSAAYSSTNIKGCTADTCETVLKELMDWGRDPTREKVCWLTGMAGTGKTTIAYTLCERLEREGILGASFFCSTTEDETHNMLNLLPTIAYALGARSQRMADAVLRALEDKPVAGMNYEDTFSALIRSPASIDKSPFYGKTRIVVLDGFDQVNDRKTFDTISSLIIKHSDTVALKFLILSWPRSNRHPQLWRYDLDERPKREVRRDIKVYVEHRLGSLAERLDDASKGWPTKEQVDLVVDRASNLFLYAATVCSYVGEEDDDQIKRRLKAVIDNAPVRGTTRSPTSKLYALYAQITTAASRRCNLDIHEVLGLIIVARDHLSLQSIASLLFENDGVEETSRVSAALSTLRSVLSVPDDPKQGIRVIHASFLDFLTDPAHSRKPYHHERPECHWKLARRCLSLMSRLLNKDDIGGLWDPDASLADIRKRSNISSAFEYACVHWGTHVMKVYKHKPELAKDLEPEIASFFDIRVLRWLAHMSVLGKLDQGVVSLRKLELQNQASEKVRRAGMEARRLVSMSSDLLQKHPLRIYYSALMQLPKKSDIAKEARKHWNWEVTHGLPEYWERCEGVLRHGRLEVQSVVFSHDGRMVASCAGREIRLWCVEELKELCMLRAPSMPSCVALSSDCKSVAAGLQSDILVWDVETKKEKAKDVHKLKSISCIAFAREDQEIVYGTPKSIHRYSIKSNKRSINTSLKLAGRLLSFSGDGKKALLKGNDCIYIIDVVTGDRKATLDFKGTRVISSAFSMDGKKVVSGLEDGTMRISDVQSGIEKVKLVGYMGGVIYVAFSGDNQRIVSGSEDGVVQIWSVLDGKEEMKLVGHTGSVTSVTYSNDSLRVASSSSDRTVQIWSVEPGLEETRPLNVSQYGVQSLALSNYDQRLFYASTYRRIQVRSVQDGKEEDSLIMRRDHANTVAISNDGKKVATVASGKILRIYSNDPSRTHPLEKTMKGHEDIILSVAFSPVRMKVASGSRDKTIRIWNMRTGEEEERLEGHTDAVCSVAFSTDGSKVASGSSDHTIRIWYIKAGRVTTLRGHTDAVSVVAFSPDNQKVVSGSHDKAVRIWNFETGDRQQYRCGGTIWSVAFSSDNSKVVSGCSDHTIYVWDLQGEGKTILKGHTAAVLSVAFSPDQNKLVSGSHDKTVRLWDLNAGKEERRMLGHMDSVQLVAFHKNCIAFSASYDGTYRTWNVQTGEEMTKVTGNTNRIHCIALSRDSRFLAVGSRDSAIRILNVEKGGEEKLEGHRKAVTFVAFSYNNDMIISVSDDKTARIWNLEKRREERKQHLGGLEVLSAAFSPDSKIIALGERDGTIWFWNIETGAKEKKLRCHYKCISSIGFVNDTHLVVWFRGETTRIGIWNVQTGEEDEKIPNAENVPILARDGWIYSPSVPNMRCWFPLKDVQRVVSNPSCIVFGLKSGDVIIVRLTQRPEGQ